MSVLSLNQFAPITAGRCVVLSLVLLALLFLYVKQRPFTKGLRCVNAPLPPPRHLVGHGTTPTALTALCRWMLYQRVGSLFCAILAQLVNIARIAEESGVPSTVIGAWAMQSFLFRECMPLHAVPSGPSLAALLVTEARAGLVCETAGGACALPFTFDGVEHHSCAGVGADTEAWCSLTPIFQGQRADCPGACLAEGPCLQRCSRPTHRCAAVYRPAARRCAGFMSSGPATAALSYALLIACASMPLLLPVSYFAVKLHDRRQFKKKSDTEEDGVEMEMRDAFKESRGKCGKRAAFEQIDTIPRQLHASQAADAAELSKASIVQVVAYCRRASMDGRFG